jgi:hypothetical protein
LFRKDNSLAASDVDYFRQNRLLSLRQRLAPISVGAFLSGLRPEPTGKMTTVENRPLHVLTLAMSAMAMFQQVSTPEKIIGLLEK